uniref:Cyclin N-terminal domain-containing protein n=1 Tax=Parastrongyloides trichosuri TaxID=131310 RepID=A0A0N5A0J7_PARTI
MDHYPVDDINTLEVSNYVKSRKRTFEEVNYDSRQSVYNSEQIYSNMAKGLNSESQNHYLTSSSNYNSLKCNEDVHSPSLYKNTIVNESSFIINNPIHDNESFKTINKIFYQQPNKSTIQSLMLHETNTVFGNFEYVVNYDEKSKEFAKKIKEKLPIELNKFGKSYEVIDLLYLKSRIYPSLEAIPLPIEKKLNGTYRVAVLEWLQEVCYAENISRVTYNSAINLMDRFFANNYVPPVHYQLIGSACLLIAAKIEEIYPPSFSKITDYSDFTFNSAQLRKAEIAIINELEFSLNPVTCYSFLSYYHLKLQDEYDDPLLDSSFDSPLKGSKRRNSIDNILKSENVSSSISNYFCSDEPKPYSEEVGEFFLKTMAIHDFIFMTHHSSYFSPSKLAASIIYAQFPNCDYDLSNLVAYKKDDVLNELDYVMPFVECSKSIEMDYTHLSSSINCPKSELKKYEVQTFSPCFRKVLYENEKLNDHIVKYNLKTEALSLKLSQKH